MLSGLVLTTKTTRVEPTDDEDCFTENIMQDGTEDQGPGLQCLLRVKDDLS